MKNLESFEFKKDDEDENSKKENFSFNNQEYKKDLKEQAKNLEKENLKAEDAATKEEKDKALDQAFHIESQLDKAEKETGLPREDLVAIYESMDKREAVKELDSVLDQAPEEIQEEVAQGSTTGFMSWLSGLGKPKNELAKIAVSLFVFTVTAFGSPKIDSLPSNVEASELKESVGWEKGVESLLQDVYESSVETTGTFIELKNGDNFWVDIKDEDTTGGVIDLKSVLQEVKEKNVQLSEVNKIVSVHTHPLSAFLVIDNHAQQIVKKFKKTPQPEGIALPPSGADMDLGFLEGTKNKYRNKIFEKNNLASENYQDGVIDPSGLWKWNKIDTEQMPSDLQLRVYVEKKKESEKKWEKLMENKLSEKIERTSTERLKELLMPNVSEHLQNYLKGGDAEREVIKTLFENTLGHNQELIKIFVDEEDLDLALDHQEYSKKGFEIDERIKEAYDRIYEKNREGETSREDIQEFIEAIYWEQIDLSFEPHSEKMFDNIK